MGSHIVPKAEQFCSNCYYPKDIIVKGRILRLCRFAGPTRGTAEHSGQLVELTGWCGQWRDEDWVEQNPQQVQIVV